MAKEAVDHYRQAGEKIEMISLLDCFQTIDVYAIGNSLVLLVLVREASLYSGQWL